MDGWTEACQRSYDYGAGDGQPKAYVDPLKVRQFERTVLARLMNVEHLRWDVLRGRLEPTPFERKVWAFEVEYLARCSIPRGESMCLPSEFQAVRLGDPFVIGPHEVEQDLTPVSTARLRNWICERIGFKGLNERGKRIYFTLPVAKALNNISALCEVRDALGLPPLAVPTYAPLVLVTQERTRAA